VRALEPKDQSAPWRTVKAESLESNTDGEKNQSNCAGSHEHRDPLASPAVLLRPQPQLTSARGKKGAAVRISDVKRELKASQGLTQQEVQSNLTYLLNQGWVEEETVEKSFTARGGTVIPSATNFYKITAAGIDKIEGPGEFTMPKFHGIKIEATGQNIITVGDGNQVNAQFGDLGKALAKLRAGVTESSAPEADKLAVVADIETIQSQLAKPQPNHGIVSAAWSAIKSVATMGEVAHLVTQVATFIQPLLT
jgi:hypothetical protein